jgi:hypothetical protein
VVAVEVAGAVWEGEAGFTARLFSSLYLVIISGTRNEGT